LSKGSRRKGKAVKLTKKGLRGPKKVAKQMVQVRHDGAGLLNMRPKMNEWFKPRVDNQLVANADTEWSRQAVE